MRSPCVLLHSDETAAFAMQLRSEVPDLEVAECNSYAALPEALQKHRPEVVYTVRFDATQQFPRDALFAEGGPRWIANGGAGTDHLGHWNTSRVIVTNAAGVAADMMAEYIMGGFLHFTLDVPGLQQDQNARRWRARTVRPIKGQVLLIVGLGHTGQALASRAKAFGMTILGTRARPRPMENVDEVGGVEALKQMLPRADFIAVATPLTSQTRGLLNNAAFSAMKRGVILADVSRGGVIETASLLAALQDGTVAGAALDVFETEPLPEDSPFWTQKNVLISPHCSSVSDDWAAASFALFLSNLKRWAAGQALFNIVDPDRGY